MTQQKSWLLPFLLGGILFSVLVFLLNSSVAETRANVINESRPALQQQPEVVLNTTEDQYSCRYGVTLNSGGQAVYLDDLKMGWFSNFTVNFPATPLPGIEYVPTVRMQQARDESTGARLPDYIITGPPLTDDGNGLGPIILAHPGSLWLIGNEVDRVDWQDDIMPQIYAKAYHDVYHFIKERDPSAQVANSGLVQVTPGRLQYLDIVWDTYLTLYGTPMPVDVWNMHVYILPEAKIENGVRVPSSLAHIALGTDINLAKLESAGDVNQCSNNDVYCFAEHDSLDIFAQQVIAMRQWMKKHGQQQKPLIITEYSQLYPYIPEGNGCFLMDELGNCFTEARVTQFLQESVTYLDTTKDATLGYSVDDNRLVQQWLWYTVNNPEEGSPSNLVYLNDNNYADGTLTPMGSAYKQAAGAELIVNLIPEQTTIPVVVQGTSTATLTASIMNNGSIAVSTPFTVTFYSDVALTQEIGSSLVTQTIGGCAREAVEVSVSWHGLGPGLHKFWGVIDSGNDVVGENKADNEFAGFVLVDPLQLFLPTVRR